jgi:hypothetical protein
VPSKAGPAWSMCNIPLTSHGPCSELHSTWEETGAEGEWLPKAVMEECGEWRANPDQDRKEGHLFKICVIN